MKCSGCREIHLCSKACLKLVWKEHKRTCEKIRAAVAPATATATDALAEDLGKVKLDKKKRLWLLLQWSEQKIIAKYMDVVSLCHMDSAMTGRAEMKEWWKALKGLNSVALNEWPRYSNANNFKGLRWRQQKHIKVWGFNLQVVYQGVPQPQYLYFSILCHLGCRDIAVLMAKTGSIPGGVNSRNEHLNDTPLYDAAKCGMKEVVSALIEAWADINLPSKEGCTPLFMASQSGHLEVVKELVRAGASIDQARKNGCTPLIMASQNGHLEVVKELVRANLTKSLNDGHTPVVLARLGGHSRIVQLLQEHGAHA